MALDERDEIDELEAPSLGDRLVEARQLGLLSQDDLTRIFAAALGRCPSSAADWADLDELLPELPARGEYHE